MQNVLLVVGLGLQDLPKFLNAVFEAIVVPQGDGLLNGIIIVPAQILEQLRVFGLLSQVVCLLGELRVVRVGLTDAALTSAPAIGPD